MPAKQPPDSASPLGPAADPPPADWVAVAEAGAPIGLKGALRIHTFNSVMGLHGEPSVLADSRQCWIKRTDGSWLAARIISCTPQTRGEKLMLDGIADRSQAEMLRGALVGVGRSTFPQAQDNETYWADLMGCEVINRSGQCLGQVIDMQSNGEHDWMVLEQGWIPFVTRHVDEVDLDRRIVRVDWEQQWF